MDALGHSLLFPQRILHKNINGDRHQNNAAGNHFLPVGIHVPQVQ